MDRFSKLGSRKTVRMAAVACMALTAVALIAAFSKDVVFAAAEKVKDGGFELATVTVDGIYSDKWRETSTNFGSPLCTVPVCGDGNGTATPRTGTYWAWFGGADAKQEKASLTQQVTFPTGSATLRFYLWIGDSSTDGKDWLRVFIDGERIVNIKESDPRYTGGYVLVQKNVSQFADGQKHKVQFKNSCTGNANGDTNPNANSNFSVDDISIQ